MPKLIISFLFIISLVVSSFPSGHGEDELLSELFTVPVPQFMGTLQPAMGIINQVISTIGTFAFGGDPRSSRALSDCVELLTKSSVEVDYTLQATNSPTGSKGNGTGNLRSDLKTWLSAASTNQDTCMQGFDGINGFVFGIIFSTLYQINSIMQQTLGMIVQTPGFGPGSGGFPTWLSHHDRKLLQDDAVVPDAVVAQDGTGDYFTIMDAVNASLDFSDTRYIIYIKSGIYDEHVVIISRKWNIMFIGDGTNETIITGYRNVVDGFTTYNSATVAINGRGFFARDITFENRAGPEKAQAVALRSDSDLSVFLRCQFQGYQDTLYAHTLRQFYKDCIVSGTVDFIFGNAAAVFQSCNMVIKQGLPRQKNAVTAQGRIDPNQPTGFTLQFCNISADADLLPNMNTTMSFLGRPWKNFSRTVVMQSYISDVINPSGWLEWNGDLNLNTLYYGEYENSGPGSNVSGRVTWPGFHVLTSRFDANNYTVSQLIDGDYWLPSTGVSYSSGLSA